MLSSASGGHKGLGHRFAWGWENIVKFLSNADWFPGFRTSENEKWSWTLTACLRLGIFSNRLAQVKVSGEFILQKFKRSCRATGLVRYVSALTMSSISRALLDKFLLSIWCHIMRSLALLCCLYNRRRLFLKKHIKVEAERLRGQRWNPVAGNELKVFGGCVSACFVVGDMTFVDIVKTDQTESLGHETVHPGHPDQEVTGRGEQSVNLFQDRCKIVNMFKG